VTHPFPYVGSGIAAARKTMSCFVAFKAAVPKTVRKQLEQGVPQPLAGWFTWHDKTLTFGNDDDSLQWTVRAAYDHVEDDEHEPDPEMPSAAMWRAFNTELDQWLLALHAKHPIALVVKPIDEEYSTETDAWHEWSCERIPEDVLPIVAALDKDAATYVAQIWRAWVETQPFDKQQEIVGALSAAQKRELAKRDALVEPTRAPPEPKLPTLEDAERIWREVAAKEEPSPLGFRLEDGFTAALIERGFDAGYELSHHVGELANADRDDDVIALSRAVLASGAEFPTNWLPGLANALIRQGRLDEVEPVVRDIVASLESYKPEMLSICMRYHAARGESDVEAILYHAGMAWFTSFTYEVPKAQAKRFGARPTDFAAAFARWLERWVGHTAWDVTTQSRMGHWLVWFDTIGTQHVATQVAAFEMERDRRNALWEQLGAAMDEPSAGALVDQLAPTADTEGACRIAAQFHQRAPLAAFALLDRAIANEHRQHYRYATGGRVNAVIMLTYLALNNAALADQLQHAYDVARGYVLVNNPALQYNLACVACRLGKRAESLGHVARALALDYAKPQQIHDDNDLASLVGDPVFEKLFADDAARREAAKQPSPKKKKPAKKKKTAAPKKKPAAPKKKPAARKRPRTARS